MTKNQWLLFGVLACSLNLAAFGCAVSPSHDRHPNQVMDAHEGHSHAAEYQAEIASDAALVAAYDGTAGPARERLLTEMRSLVIVAGVTQKLASGFDLMISRLAQRGQIIDPAQLNNSQLNCELWENAHLNEGAEVRLLAMQDLLLSRNQQESYAWFLSYFKATKIDTVAELMAKAQLLRSLKENHEEFCEKASCPDFIEFAGRPQAPFDPFNDQDMLAFKTRNLAKIAVGNAQELFARAGNCFDAASIRSPNAEEYNWKKRNSTGKSLAKGQFIVTYDDGPHPKFTEAIASEWANAGLAKPAFYWLSDNAIKYPEIVEWVHGQGFEVACHSQQHPDIGNLAKATSFEGMSKANRTLFKKDAAVAAGAGFGPWQQKMLDQQIVTSTKAISNVVSKRSGQAYSVRRFRLPYGSGVGNASVGRRLASLNVNHDFWAVDSLDWQDKNPASVAARVREQMNLVGRGIILFHDIHKQSLQATQLLIQQTKGSNAARYVTFDDVGL